ncbi:MAG: hypothetical protein LBU18_07055 [Treponema sp.]|jgi:ABC-type amino acid transport substrate-binding protein|nr:hypothetical protein [Treponema sp.]
MKRNIFLHRRQLGRLRAGLVFALAGVCTLALLADCKTEIVDAPLTLPRAELIFFNNSGDKLKVKVAAADGAAKYTSVSPEKAVEIAGDGGSAIFTITWDILYQNNGSDPVEWTLYTEDGMTAGFSGPAGDIFMKNTSTSRTIKKNVSYSLSR